MRLFLFSSFNLQVNDLDNIKTIEAKIKSSLIIGTSKTEVEAFLIKTDWVYSFNKYDKSFVALTNDETAECIDSGFLLWLLYDCSISVVLVLDSSNNYSGYKLEQTYSGL